MSRARAGLLLVLLLAALVPPVLGALPAVGAEGRPSPRVDPRVLGSARVVADPFTPGRPYAGDFPDPAILRVGRTYYGFSTTFAGMNAPVVRTTDLIHWTAVGEGQMRAASWADWHSTRTGTVATTWAPSGFRVGRVYVHAYATPVRGVTPRKMCISVSRSLRPTAGYVDRTTRPLVCPSGRGAIDPHYFTDPDGRRYLLWKSEQTGGYPAQLWATRVTSDGLRLVYPNHKLLEVAMPWERGIIENPSMIGYHGRWYLFYSGGSYADASYATGYAVCETPIGPCTRMGTDGRLLTSGGTVAGPGGAMAFYDNIYRLRLAYAAWDAGHTGYPASRACLSTAYGCNQRRLHVATLAADPSPDAQPGALVVTARG